MKSEPVLLGGHRFRFLRKKIAIFATMTHILLILTFLLSFLSGAKNEACEAAHCFFAGCACFRSIIMDIGSMAGKQYPLYKVSKEQITALEAINPQSKK